MRRASTHRKMPGSPRKNTQVRTPITQPLTSMAPVMPMHTRGEIPPRRKSRPRKARPSLAKRRSRRRPIIRRCRARADRSYHPQVQAAPTTTYHPQVQQNSTPSYHPQAQGEGGQVYHPQVQQTPAPTSHPQAQSEGGQVYHPPSQFQPDERRDPSPAAAGRVATGAHVPPTNRVCADLPSANARTPADAKPGRRRPELPSASPAATRSAAPSSPASRAHTRREAGGGCSARPPTATRTGKISRGTRGGDLTE